MLREIQNTRQIAGEPPRIWYFGRELDLVVWFDPQAEPMAFQLAYDKHKDERSLSWTAERGYVRHLVDHGPRAATPLLISGGAFPRERVLAAFLDQSKDLPPGVVSFVAEKLGGYDGVLESAQDSEALRVQRALERLGFNSPDEGG